MVGQKAGEVGGIDVRRRNVINVGAGQNKGFKGQTSKGNWECTPRTHISGAMHHVGPDRIATLVGIEESDASRQGEGLVEVDGNSVSQSYTDSV